MADINLKSKKLQQPRTNTGVYADFNCGHQIPANAVLTEKEKSTLKTFICGFEVYQSDDDCRPSCKGEDHFQDEMSDKFMNHKLRFSAKFHNPMRGENSDRSGLNENFRQYCSKPAILRERTDSSLLKIEALDQQEREQDLDEMMHSTTFDLAPESRLPERKESKREKVKALGHSIWESLKKVR